MPKSLVKDEESTETYAKFVAEPFEAGYGHTVGNSLRRVLLSSLEGAAITSVRITGALHEFATLPNVVEDVTDIVLNLKKIKFKANDHEIRNLSISVNREGPVTAADINGSAQCEVMNKDQHHLHAGQEAEVRGGTRGEGGTRLRHRRGKQAPGPADRRHPHRFDFFARDAGSNTRWRTPASASGRITTSSSSKSGPTDGITPDEALLQASAILRQHLDVVRQLRRERGGIRRDAGSRSARKTRS